jgi:hypothetical protein
MRYKAAWIMAAALLLQQPTASAFLAPLQPVTTTRTHRSKQFVVYPDVTIMSPAIMNSNNLLALDYVELSKNFAIGTITFATLLVGITYVFVNVLMPQAAQQLKDQVQDLDPSLWKEYQDKLGPGETLSTRPDLMQELGEKVMKVMDNQQKQQERDRIADADIVVKDYTTTNQWDD